MVWPSALCTPFCSPKTWRAKVSLMMATFGAVSLSWSRKSRPSRIGIPAVLKKSGPTGLKRLAIPSPGPGVYRHADNAAPSRAGYQSAAREAHRRNSRNRPRVFQQIPVEVHEARSLVSNECGIHRQNQNVLRAKAEVHTEKFLQTVSE